MIIHTFRLTLSIKQGTLLLLLFLSYSLPKLTAQLSTEDSAFYKKAVNNTVALYHQSIGDQSGLFNGNQYPGYPSTFKEGGHPFFNVQHPDKSGIPTPSRGSIVYDKVFYPDVQILYDEIAGVIILHDATHRIQLHTNKVSYFTILDNRFIRIVKDSLSGAPIQTGFYQVLYNGKVSVLKREVKLIDEKIGSFSEGISRFIKIKYYYYIEKNKAFFVVNSTQSMLNAFKDQQHDVKQFVKRNKLDFGKDAENALIQIAAYYDILTK